MNATLKSPHFRPIRASIDLEALRSNLKLVRSLVGPRLILGMVKANAYGHGAVPVAKVLVDGGVGILGVASPEEGVHLREFGITAPILLLGGAFDAPGDFLREYQLTPVLHHISQIENLCKTTSSYLDVQLKVDTGMTRLGIFPHELVSFVQALRESGKLRLTGVLTHLASADTNSVGSTSAQYALFEAVESELKSIAPEVTCLHIANSAAILDENLDLYQGVRPGLMLYGVNPNPRFEQGKNLKQVMRFESQIISIKNISPSTAVSYGGEWVAGRPSRIAVLAVGYADGYHRALGNRAEVVLRGQRVPVVGRVCMDLTMVDVTDLSKVEIGDWATLWGPDLPLTELAEKAGTIAYELMCAVSARVPRVYCEDLER